jgi:hypothetical protein
MFVRVQRHIAEKPNPSTLRYEGQTTLASAVAAHGSLRTLTNKEEDQA